MNGNSTAMVPLNNGVTVEEIRAIIHVVGIYCGVPQALECFRAARTVFEQRGVLPKQSAGDDPKAI